MDIAALQDILRTFADRLPPGPIRDRFLAFKLNELAALDINGPVWRGFIEALPPDGREALGRQLVIATKQTRH